MDELNRLYAVYSVRIAKAAGYFSGITDVKKNRSSFGPFILFVN